MERALQGSSAAQLALLDAPGTERRNFAEGGGDHDHDHAGEEDHDHAAEGEAEHDHEGEEHEHHHTGTDPHAWLDPENAMVWTGLISAELTRLDPENAATYAANAEAARARIATLDADLKTQLAPVADKPFVAFHDAYGYFTAHYGRSPRAIWHWGMPRPSARPISPSCAPRLQRAASSACSPRCSMTPPF